MDEKGEGRRIKRRIARKIAKRFATGIYGVRVTTWRKAMTKLASEEVMEWILIPAMKQAESQLAAFKAAMGGYEDRVASERNGET